MQPLATISNAFQEFLATAPAINIPISELLLCMLIISCTILMERYLVMGLTAYVFLLKWLVFREDNLFSATESTYIVPVLSLFMFGILGIFILIYHLFSSSSSDKAR